MWTDMKDAIKIILVLLAAGNTPLCAQDFLQQGNQWIFEYNVYEPLPDPLVSQTIETITIDSDTLINNLPYSKLIASLPAPCGIFNETEFLREEGSKIFRLSQDLTQEFLMIDFGETTGYEILYEAGVGDIDTGTVIVDSFGIEVLNDGSQHEVQYVRILNNGSFDDDAQYKVYKHIGFVQNGLLFPNLGTGLCDGMEDIQLRCYISEQDTIHFQQMDCYASDLIDATNEVEKEIINLYPNPTNDFINIPSNLRVIEIVNANGQKQISFEEGSILDLRKCQSGLYIIKFSSPDRDKMYIGKVIKM